MDKPSQSKGPVNNAQVGKAFEAKVQQFFANQGLMLQPGIEVSIGINEEKKPHQFNLGNEKVLVECKAYRYRKNGEIPHGKMAILNEAMLLFLATPPDFRKILCVIKDVHQKRNETLAQHYIRTHGHLIPNDVEIWEYDEQQSVANRVK